MIALALLVAVFVVVAAVRTRAAVRASGRMEVRATWTLVGLSAVNLGFVSGFVALFTAASGDPVSIMFDFPPPGTGALLVLPVAGAVLTLAAAWFAAALWVRRGSWTFGKRLRYAGATLVNVLFLLVLHHWNLVGWNYH